MNVLDEKGLGRMLYLGMMLYKLYILPPSMNSLLYIHVYMVMPMHLTIALLIHNTNAYTCMYMLMRDAEKGVVVH